VFLLSVWALHVRPHRHGVLYDGAFFAAAGLTLAAAVSPYPLPVMALVLVAFVAVCVVSQRSRIG
jgi:hypothetical protein